MSPAGAPVNADAWEVTWPEYAKDAQRIGRMTGHLSTDSSDQADKKEHDRSDEES